MWNVGNGANVLVGLDLWVGCAGCAANYKFYGILVLHLNKKRNCSKKRNYQSRQSRVCFSVRAHNFRYSQGRMEFIFAFS